MTETFEHSLQPPSLFSMDNTDYKLHDFEYNVDPENHVFNTINATCAYYTEEQFRDTVDLHNTFSLIHFNCRSLYKSFTPINDFLNTLKGEIKIIALSETWIDAERGCDFHIDGYELYHTNRSNKKSGGVALFVDNTLKCKSVDFMTMAIDELMECVTVEIEMEKRSNIIVTCIYRKPGSVIETFTDALEDILSKVNENKTLFLCGDTNVDLLKVSSHKATSEYLESLYSRGFGSSLCLGD